MQQHAIDVWLNWWRNITKMLNEHSDMHTHPRLPTCCLILLMFEVTQVINGWWFYSVRKVQEKLIIYEYKSVTPKLFAHRGTASTGVRKKKDAVNWSFLRNQLKLCERVTCQLEGDETSWFLLPVMLPVVFGWITIKTVHTLIFLLL